ncbi:MAG: [Ni/Fe] hydrogenase small subunit [Flavobacteriales bacterium CG_4_8_14_3_um_filter_35_10]|nr:hydrogenase small subunit [Zetaproteobacteria bacterium]NDK18036.1 hydrogenase small subunit [Flavobacteriales bacterium]OIO12428.1 MAG: hydrogenase [Flavobacteriaceae bacterium CG1_02_35_72]PIR13870.1 MAG: [Ni/Fe] hydrogenase small subunit [Flavobacteriales bacterium CG11_big_fil_rev_8_21_14_0_20_35_7]PIX07970.1 MAG: [Ni/Fe] hydrogenase small subunit [Flavobacteriales bacterium CG_4_8_14_3_um_filter_35_10]PJA05126.1 MAG: [Ni/Fe] hydrogenase small subunit [Flavobacteriales bacterium CG_4_10
MSASEEKRNTYYESIIKQGYSRRDFMKFTTYMAAFMGLENSMVGQIAKSLETTPRLPVIWEHYQECTCCSESFIRSDHPIVADIILDKISLDYTLTLMAASGHQAEAAKQETMKKYKGEYILCVEGSIPLGDDGNYCCIAGKTAKQSFLEAAEGAKAIIAWGSCASNGCVQSAKPNPTEATPIHKILKNKPIIRVPGCPPIGEVMAGVIVHVVAFGRLPELDGQGRPKAFYSKRVHDSCYRRPYYDAGLFAETFDDKNSKEGYCLYKLGCKGPMTYNSCGTLKWNNGVSYPIQSGHGCLGCSENGFWDNGPFYERKTNVPGFSEGNSADTVGKVAAGVLVGGIAVHALAANISKRKEVKDRIERGIKNEQHIDS